MRINYRFFSDLIGASTLVQGGPIYIVDLRRVR